MIPTDEELAAVKDAPDRFRDPEFWRRRIASFAVKGKGVRAGISPCTDARWSKINEKTRKVLIEHIAPNSRVLDAGCGCGDLYPLLPEGCTYLGFDLVTEFVEEARRRFPLGHFVVGSLPLNDLSGYTDGEFDWVICRGLSDGFLDGTPGLLDGLRRVGSRVLIMSFYNPHVGYRVLE